MNNLDYGIIGNCKSAALISKNGSIDWCCLPQFDSSSVFAKILDTKKGGSFEIICDKSYKISQHYIKRTNLLVTRFDDCENCFEVIDFMPRYIDENTHHTPPDIIRYFKHRYGTPRFKIKYQPQLEYSEYPTKTFIEHDYIKSSTMRGTYDSLYLYTSFNRESVLNNDTISLQKDEFSLLSYNQKILGQNIDRCYMKMERTKVYWLTWAEKTKEYSKYNNEILRSALTLKLLSFDKSGAVLAALTTSLPETIGEIRNWDYRFCWLRDASMVIKVMTELGHINVARRYLNFIIDIIPDKDEKIQIMYGISGQRKLTEKTLDHLSGYENSRPVRIGNAAYKQKQNDIYGVLMDVLYQQFSILGTSLEESEALWTITRSIIKIVEKNWRKPDKGIWELRTENKHFTFSKVLCWVAVDRGLKIAEMVNRIDYAKNWRKLRTRIEADIHVRAWNEDINAFTQAYGVTDLDASVLLMEPYGFIEKTDPKYKATVLAIEKELCVDGLMYRYKNSDDFGEPKSSFTICTFWLIDAMYKIGNRQQATEMFHQLLSYSNHLGLYSEDIEFATKRLLGNFPQAYSHLALIQTAITLSQGSKSDKEQILEALHE